VVILSKPLQIAPFTVLVVNLTVGAALLVAAIVSPLVRAWSRHSLVLAGGLLAVLPLADALLLGLFVFGEDSYRDNGTSRWNAYRRPGGALGPMFVLSVVLLTAASAVLAYAGLRRRGRLLVATSLAAALTAVLLVTATIFGFNAN